MVKTEFSIKDLENLSGVKAHTIRIWEKRYSLFSPDRTETNIRKYNLEGLKKLLNVTQLYNQGHKISKIACLSDSEIQKLTTCNEASKKDLDLINKYKTAMLSFDYELFDTTYKEMDKRYSFPDSFEKILIPLLKEVGYLWQIGTLDPVHERYISELVRQKITLKIEDALSRFKKKSNKVIAFFLPLNEIHELGLLFAQYLVIKAGFPTLYLGSNIPLSSLSHVTKHHNDVVFMTYLTTQPTSLTEYVTAFNDKMSTEKRFDLWCLGTKAKEINTIQTTPNIKVITEIKEFNSQINLLKDA